MWTITNTNSSSTTQIKYIKLFPCFHFKSDNNLHRKRKYIIEEEDTLAQIVKVKIEKIKSFILARSKIKKQCQTTFTLHLLLTWRSCQWNWRMGRKVLSTYLNSRGEDKKTNVELGNKLFNSNCINFSVTLCIIFCMHNVKTVEHSREKSNTEKDVRLKLLS